MKVAIMTAAGIAICIGIISLAVVSIVSDVGNWYNLQTKQLHNDKVGLLEAKGQDLRVYEFTPQTAPNKQCVFVAGNGKAGLQCWDKK